VTIFPARHRFQSKEATSNTQTSARPTPGVCSCGSTGEFCCDEPS
jgi:hypothetical protein